MKYSQYDNDISPILEYYKTSLKPVLNKVTMIFKPIFEKLHQPDNFVTFLPIVQSEFNTILTVSPLKPMTIDFLGNKRIRNITPPVVEKISVSPFNIKTSNFEPKTTVFKDLNEAFKKK